MAEYNDILSKEGEFVLHYNKEKISNKRPETLQKHDYKNLNPLTSLYSSN